MPTTEERIKDVEDFLKRTNHYKPLGEQESKPVDDGKTTEEINQAIIDSEKSA